MAGIGDSLRQSLEAAQMRMHNAVNKSIEEFEVLMRPVLKKSFQCQMNCCDNTQLHADAFQQCIHDCTTPIQKVQHTLNHEAKSLQDRYMRCNQACEDELKDLMHTYTKPDGTPNMGAIEPKLVACVERCTQSHIELLPAMMQRLRTSASR